MSTENFGSNKSSGQVPRIAIVSGASSGVGVEFLKQIDERYSEIDELWLLARRENRMLDLEAGLRKPCRIFAADLTDETEMEAFWSALSESNVTIRLLINNAGYGRSGNFSEIEESVNLGMIELNNLALVRMTQRCLPYMAKGAKILNIASVAAFLPQPKFAVYAASKSFVLSFSRALNYELRKQDITVTAVCPNPMATEFFTIAGDKPAKSSFKDIGLEPVDRMVRTALRKAERGKDVSTSCWQAKAVLVFSRILPHRFILRIMGLLGIAD